MAEDFHVLFPATSHKKNRFYCTIMFELKPMTLVAKKLGLVKFHDLHWLPISRGFRWFQCPEFFTEASFERFRTSDVMIGPEPRMDLKTGKIQCSVEIWFATCWMWMERSLSEDWIPWFPTSLIRDFREKSICSSTFAREYTRSWFRLTKKNTPTWGDDPSWLICFKWVWETTNQI